MLLTDEGQKKQVIIDYTNWKGDRRKRLILPHSVSYCATEFHKEPQWLLVAMDCEEMKPKTFAMKDIHSWEPIIQDDCPSGTSRRFGT